MHTRLQPFLEVVRHIAPQLPTGLADSYATTKLANEYHELHTALQLGDQIGALTELADVAYYAAKAVLNTLQTDQEALATIDSACQQLQTTRAVAFHLLDTKYTLRVTGQKDDARERQAIVEALNIWCFFDSAAAPYYAQYHHVDVASPYRPLRHGFRDGTAIVDVYDPQTGIHVPHVYCHHLTIAFDQ